MGADLIGYLVVGPDKLDKEKLQDAVVHVGKLHSIAVRMNALREKDPDEYDRAVEKKHKWIAPLLESVPGWDPDVDAQVDFLADIDPEKERSDFAKFWKDRDYRDVNWRPDPHDEKEIILFAGEMSWGDRPYGAGYQVLERADRLGLFPLLGIR